MTDREEWIAKIDRSIAAYNARIGEEISKYKSEMRRGIIQKARDLGLPEPAIRYLSR